MYINNIGIEGFILIAIFIALVLYGLYLMVEILEATNKSLEEDIKELDNTTKNESN